MEITWQQSNWQNSQLNSRQAIVFVLSSVLLYLLLLIPVKFKTIWQSQDSQISVILVKEKNKEVQNPVINPVINPIIKPLIEPVIQPTTEVQKPVTKPIKEIKNTVKEPIIRQVPINTVIAVKPKLPSAGVILNSIKLTKPLPTVSQDFRQTSENDLDFIPKQWVKPKETRLIVEEDQIQAMVNIKTPLALKTLKSAVGFFITPVEDRVKTQDTLNYCPTLGRRSVFCPNANPLFD